MRCSRHEAHHAMLLERGSAGQIICRRRRGLEAFHWKSLGFRASLADWWQKYVAVAEGLHSGFYRWRKRLGITKRSTGVGRWVVFILFVHQSQNIMNTKLNAAVGPSEPLSTQGQV